ncbi:MAG: ATP-binding protein [Kiritimatiellae bacterium]|nr:ATP-binding protein [Kiritimatiellia bacterium]
MRDILGITPEVSSKKRDGKTIIEIKVDYSAAPISYHGRFYTRSGSTISELKGHELSEFLMTKSGKSWDGFFEEGATLKDIDMPTIRTFKRLAVKRIPFIQGEKNMAVVLRKLNLIENGRLRRAAILLFGKDPKRFYITAYIKIGKFINDTDIISTDNVEGNLFQQIEKAMDILRIKYLVSNISYEGIYRKDTLEYPEEALREALINAVIHRSYIGAHTQLKIYPDTLNLWNDGGLPASIRIEDLKKLHTSKPRNEFLADVFFKAGMIEAWGRGTTKIVDACKKAGLPEPEFREEFGGLSVTFFKPKVEEMPEKTRVETGVKTRVETRVKILSLLRKNPAMSASELAKTTGLTIKGIEWHLTRLRTAGLIRHVGARKGGYWKVTAGKNKP